MSTVGRPDPQNKEPIPPGYESYVTDSESYLATDAPEISNSWISRHVSSAVKSGLKSVVSEAVTNKKEISSYIRAAVNEALFQQPSPKLFSTRKCISEFLASPDTKQWELLHSQLRDIGLDENTPESVSAMILMLPRNMPAEEGQPSAALKPDFVEKLNKVDQALGSVITANTGSVVALREIYREEKKEVIEDLAQAPKKMLSSFLPSRPANQKEANSSPAAPLMAKDETDCYGVFLTECQTFFSKIASNAFDAFNGIAAERLAAALLLTFGSIKDHIEKNPHQHQDKTSIIGRVDQLIKDVTNAQKKGSLRDLLPSLKASLNLMQEQQVYFQGFRLPLNSVKFTRPPMRDYIALKESHDNALGNSNLPISQRITSKDIDLELSNLVQRSSAYGAIKFINEYLLGLKPDQKFYTAIVEPSSTHPDQSASSIKKSYYEWIGKQKEIPFFFRWAAKTTYFIGVHSSSFFLGSMIGNVIKSFQEWNRSPDDLGNKEIQIIQLLRNWTAKLSASYNQVAKTPDEQVADLSAMLLDAIQLPERNGGLTSSELYAAFSESVMEVYGPRVHWRTSVTNFFNFKIPCSSLFRIFNPILKFCNVLSSWTLNTLLLIPEWIANALLRGGTQMYLRQSRILEKTLNQTIHSLTSNTATAHAFNTVLYHQLLQAKKSVGATLNRPKGVDLGGQFTENKKQEIKKLIRYVFEVLNKSRCSTQDELSSLLKGSLPIRERLEKEFDEMFLPDALETASSFISLSFNAFMSEEAQNQFVHDLLTLFNKSLSQVAAEKSVEHTQIQFAAVEKGIRDTIDEILEASITYAISDRLDFSADRLKQHIQQFVNDLKSQSIGSPDKQIPGVVKTIRDGLARINPSDEASNVESEFEVLKSLIDSSSEFLSSRANADLGTSGNRSIDTAVKGALNQISEKLIKEYQPSGDCLNQGLKTCKEIKEVNSCNTTWGKTKSIFGEIHTFFSKDQMDASDINAVNSKLEEIDLLLGAFNSLPLSERFTDKTAFNEFYGKLKQSLTQASSSFEHAEKLAHEAATLFDAFKTMKRNALGVKNPPKEVGLKRTELSHLITTMPDCDLRKSLFDQITRLDKAGTPADIDTISAQFKNSREEMATEMLNQFQSAITHSKENREQLEGKVTQYQLEATNSVAQNKLRLIETIKNLEQNLEQFSKWVETVDPIPIWDLGNFDMKWVTEIAKNLAFARAKEKVTEVINALYQKHNYIGILHQMVFLPFLEKHTPYYLKKS